MSALLIFASTFVLVFALGFQSLNVNNGHYKAAFLTSFAIAASNLILFKTIPQADWLEIAAYLAAGPLAIIASMWSHKRLIKTKPRKSTKNISSYPRAPQNPFNPVKQTTPERRTKA